MDERPDTAIETLADVRVRRSALRPMDRVGRYTIVEPVGTGGMGVVYLAHDPELDRPVAIKVLHREVSQRDVASRRLLREARAMARLHHPNVVVVHDVGTFEGHVFIAMEFVDGTDLRGWLQTPRSWREIMTALVQAARGLAAAHEAGVVHRDFKPDNVMVDRRGRVCVTDFGLAASGGEPMAQTDDPTGPIATHGIRDDADVLTRTGALIGTPAYLSPEQFGGRPADELTDQFAFCVSLWEALYGERPFAGKTVAELALATVAGELSAPPISRRVPARLRRIVARGLSRDRTRRWPSMAALLGALERVLAQRRRYVAAGVLAIAASTATAAYLGAREREPACDPSHAVAAAWNDATRARIFDHMMAVAPDLAEDLDARIDTRTRAWTDAWSETYRSICTRDTIWSDALLDRAGACLERRLGDLRASLDAIARIDLVRASKILDVLDRLPPPQTCADREWLSSDVEPPADPETAAAVDSLRHHASELRARDLAGDYDGVEAQVAALVDSAKEVAYAPIVAELLLQHGHALLALGRIGEAQARFEEAFYAATSSQHARIALAAATVLVNAHGRVGGRPDEGMTWARHARALLDALPPDPVARAELDLAVADVHLGRNEIEAARTLMQAALAAFEAAGLPRRVANTTNALAVVALRNGEAELAQSLYEKARALSLDLLGPNHPDSISPLVGLASLASRRGDLDDAANMIRLALSSYEATFGPEHIYVAGAMHNLGSIEHRRGYHAQARALLEGSLALRKRSLGEQHPDVAASLGLLATVYEDIGEIGEARAANEQALAIFIATYGEDHPHVADVLENLGTLAVAEGDPAGALEVLERSVSIRRKSQGDDHPDSARTLEALAKARLQTGDREGARSDAEAACRICDAREAPEHTHCATARKLCEELATGSPADPK